MLQQSYYIALGLFCFTGSICVAQTPDSNELLEQLNSAEEGLAFLEVRFDRFDPRLVEALDQLADQFIALDQFNDAHAVLDRATQITRVAEGLFTPLQIPLLHKKISNFANRGNWQAARSLAEHLLWLYREKTPVNAELVVGLMKMTDFHLRGIVEDLPELRAYHFRRAMTANEIALLVAQNVWHAHDPRIAAVTYQLVKQHYLQSAAIDLGGETAYALREIVPGTRWVQDKDTVHRQHYYLGLDLLRQMSTVYSNAAEPDAEALAMVKLYIADWQVLYTRREDALGDYQSAYDSLVESGIDSERINAYLTVPEVLPVSEFFPSLAAAQADRNAAPVPSATESSRTNMQALQFNAWSPAFPNVMEPAFHARANDPDADFALMSFSLAGLSEVSRWVSGRYRTGIGVAESMKLLEVQMDLVEDEAELFNKLQGLRFRPGLFDGAPTHATGTLKYIVAND